MSKPKVLFVVEKWSECNPTHPLSLSHHVFIGSLEALGLADVHTFFFDEVSWHSGQKCDLALLEKCAAYKPDMLFMTMVQGTDLNPSPDSLAHIRDKLGIKVVASYGDTYNQEAIKWIESYSNVVTLNLILDNYSAYRRYAADAKVYMAAWTPQHPGIFYKDNRERNIDVCFIGSVTQYPQRKLAISFLSENGIDIVCRGGQLDDNIPIEDYADYMRLSKISLNFSNAAYSLDQHHCKGRVFESTLCGALLMEQENGETHKWFEPGVDYIEFSHERDLLEKVRYYLANSNERQEIAARGTAKAETSYSAEAFWGRLLQRLQDGATG